MVGRRKRKHDAAGDTNKPQLCDLSPLETFLLLLHRLFSLLLV